MSQQSINYVCVACDHEGQRMQKNAQAFMHVVALLACDHSKLFVFPKDRALLTDKIVTL
jgi:hypothetical protein